MQDLCSTTDVMRIIDCVGRYGTTDIGYEIAEQTQYIYDEYGNPLQAIISGVDKDDITNDYYTKYFLGERSIERVDKVYMGTATKTELVSSTDYVVSTSAGIVKMQSSTTLGGVAITDDSEMIIWFAGMPYKKLCAIRTAEKLLEKSDTMSGDKTSKELQVIKDRRKEYEDLIRQKIEMQLTDKYLDWDEDYDTNMFSLTQQFQRNKYLSTV